MELSCIKQEQGFEIFENEQFGQIRVVMRDGEPWFVAADVCKALEVDNSRQATSRLDEDEKFTTVISNDGAATGKSSMTFVNEPGLYSLVLSSRKPEAKTFRRWITHEVIPSIRKHGMYATPATVEAMLADPDFAITLLTNLKQERAARLAAESQNLIMQPKANYYDKIVEHDVNLGLRQFIKECGLKQKKFIDYLLDNKYLYRDKRGTLIPYAEYIDKLFVVKEYVADNGYGGIQTLITPEGRNYFLNKINIKAVLGC